LLEVGQQLVAPLAHALGERGEGWDLCAIDGGQEGVEASLGFVAAGGAIDRSECFL